MSLCYRIVNKRHLKITTAIDKVTVDAYQDVQSHNFLDNTPAADNNTTAGESKNVSADSDKEDGTFERNDLKNILLLLVFGICACIYGSMYIKCGCHNGLVGK